MLGGWWRLRRRRRMHHRLFQGAVLWVMFRVAVRIRVAAVYICSVQICSYKMLFPAKKGVLQHRIFTRVCT